MTEVREIKTTQSELSAQNPTESAGKTDTPKETSKAMKDQTIVEELVASDESITLEKINVKALGRVKKLRSKSPERSQELVVAQTIVEEAVKNPKNFQADFVFRGETTPPQDTDLVRVLYDIAEKTKKGQTVVNVKGKLEDWIYELEVSTNDKTEESKREIRKYKDKLLKKWTEMVVDESERQEIDQPSQKRATKSQKEKAAEFWQTNAVAGENARLDQIEKRIRSGSASQRGGQANPPQELKWADVPQAVQDLVSDPSFDQNNPQHKQLRDLVSAAHDLQVHGLFDDRQRTEFARNLAMLNGDIRTNPSLDSLRRRVMNRMSKDVQVARSKQEEEEKEDRAFRTISGQYLTDDEKQNIREGGPAYWEGFKDEIIFLLTADPNSDVSQDQSLQHKISALQDYIRSHGIDYFTKHGIPLNEARRRVSDFVDKTGIDIRDAIHLHNVVRAARASNDITDIVKYFGSVPQETLNELMGRTYTGDKRRIATDAIRLYEQAAIARVAEKYRRHLYLTKKSETTVLSTDEQNELKGGYILLNKDILPLGSLWESLNRKRRRLNVWEKVYTYGRTNNMGTEQAVDALMAESKLVWDQINERMKGKILQEQAISELVAEGKLKTGIQIIFTEDDRDVFYELQREAIHQGIQNPDENSVKLLQAYTDTEKELLESDFEEAGTYYSPVEQIVFDALWTSERVRLDTEYTDRKSKNEFKSPEAEKQWYANEVQRRKNYVRIGIRNARQLMIVTSHLPKINATVGKMAEDVGDATLQGFDMEYLLRGLNHEVMMHQRYGHYGQPVVKEFSHLIYLKFFRDEYGKQLALNRLPEWNALIQQAIEKKDEKGLPDAQTGFREVVKYLNKKLGIPYSMMYTSEYMKIGGILDPGSWRDTLSQRRLVEQILEQTGKLGPIGDPNSNRFEYTLGIQIEVAKDLNSEEVNRASDGFENMKFLLRRMIDERNLTGLNERSSNDEIESAREYVRKRLSPKDIGLIGKMQEKIAAYQVALQGNNQGEITEKRKAVQDLFSSDDFKQVQSELIVERKKYILEQVSFRLPTVIGQFYVEDTYKIINSEFRKNSHLQAEMRAKNLTGSEADAFVNGRIEKIWRELQNALYAVQNDVVRHKIANKDVEKYFGRQAQAFPVLNNYLERFLRNDYNAYADTCFEITKQLRNYFTDMKQGKTGRARGMSGDDAKFVGIEQLTMNARFTLPITRLADSLYEERQLGFEGGDSVLKRRNHEIEVMAKMMPGLLDGVITGIHKTEMAEIVKQIGAFVKEYAGVYEPKEGAPRGKNILEAWIEMVKAPALLESNPILEKPFRWLAGNDNKQFRDFVMEQGGSRLMKLTRDPNDPILQKNEQRQLVDMAWTVDAFLQQPEMFNQLYHEFHLTNKDLSKYQMQAILPYIAIALALLIVVEGWAILQQGEEES
ncbi:hypothetical protein A3A55_01825 [Candidatus Roizmanbacteria bacterium RIFCSPLOWO2_01_FULL_40_14]|uniref:Uncharacterized protein n=3 Tax=Candidatus Roizmaniibacteriota TaxID=1752723 RepID=A0A0G0VK65_9BACT|nr:MAG: hypothetical protein UT85_C0025G0012 [Candidatus Levybacteria bacterium GW2011_GWA2_40_16]KKR72345.1 MAG: hypothetical protein UU14_C0007G0026 [Candidatus Roizmanbacteria bacterium GW2011_GWB1_40_7]KKR91452.1 MAG: hypothetical protein UU41_C0037G0007 [Candidatus Roizmanbacteria bacterium GW2011_GWA1_41_13]OGK50384.1 MAG: hypothetical protein A3A55_01825 [Candidatus Roizmanbacteria bacterium RIFCSPLOWO2_01_FULL_40_14]